MSALYDLYENPDNTASGEKQPLHARFVPVGRVTTNELCERAGDGTTFSTPELKGALQCLTDTVIELLKEGKVVEFGEFGTMSISLKCRPVMEKSEIRSSSVKVKSLTLRPSKQMKDRLSTIRLERNPFGWQSKDIDPKKLEERLTAYFAQNPVMRSPDYCRLRVCKRCKGVKELNELVEQGKLLRDGRAGATVYLPVAGYFGK